MAYHKDVGRYSAVGVATELWVGRFGDRIPAGTSFSAPVQTGPGTHPAYNTVREVSFSEV